MTDVLEQTKTAYETRKETAQERKEQIVGEIGEVATMKVLAQVNAFRMLFASVVDHDQDQDIAELLDIISDKVNAIEGAELISSKEDILNGEVGTVRLTSEQDGTSVFVDLFIFKTQQWTDSERETLDIAWYMEMHLDNRKFYTEIPINDFVIAVKGRDNVSLQVNDTVVNGSTFVYDGCHKLYVIADEDDRANAKEMGYIVDGSTKEDETEHAIADLEYYYAKSCPLRFIHPFNLKGEILSQCSTLPMFIYY